MKLLLDAFWRAVGYCVHPQVIGLSLVPLVVAMTLAVGLGWFYWEAAVAAVRETLERWSLIDTALRWVESNIGAQFRAVIAPLVVVVLAVPIIVVLVLMLVALTMMPAIVRIVEERRFPSLERRYGAGFAASVLYTLGCALLAVLALLVSLPLWLVPPVGMVLPPLILGWLNFKVMSFDALATYASRDERRAIVRAHHWPLLSIGVITGFLSAAPTLVWTASAMMLVYAPVLIPLSVWLYTLVFAFASLWFAHYVLAVLAAMRADEAAQAQREPASKRETLPMPEVLPSTLSAPPALPPGHP